MNNDNNVGAETNVTPKESWLKANVARPFMWIAVGFVACKVLDAYTESKRTRRLTE